MTDVKPWVTMNESQRKARYGVVYMRNIAAQAGCSFDETAPGEDVLAIDYMLGFTENIVRVQVKTTYTHKIDGDIAEFTYAAHDDWIRK